MGESSDPRTQVRTTADDLWIVRLAGAEQTPSLRASIAALGPEAPR